MSTEYGLLAGHLGLRKATLSAPNRGGETDRAPTNCWHKGRLCCTQDLHRVPPGVLLSTVTVTPRFDGLKPAARPCSSVHDTHSISGRTSEHQWLPDSTGTTTKHHQFQGHPNKRGSFMNVEPALSRVPLPRRPSRCPAPRTSLKPGWEAPPTKKGTAGPKSPLLQSESPPPQAVG